MKNGPPPALLDKYRDVLAGAPSRPGAPVRPVPRLKRHKLGVACVSFKVRGRRVWRYFGVWGSRAARAKYAAFRRAWPSPLAEERQAGKWPAARLLTHDGRTQRLSEWAKETGLRAGTIRFRIDNLKWSVSRALTTPKQKPFFARDPTSPQVRSQRRPTLLTGRDAGHLPRPDALR